MSIASRTSVEDCWLMKAEILDIVLLCMKLVVSIRIEILRSSRTGKCGIVKSIRSIFSRGTSNFRFRSCEA